MTVGALKLVIKNVKPKDFSLNCLSDFDLKDVHFMNQGELQYLEELNVEDFFLESF
jgi:hypothetical protein